MTAHPLLWRNDPGVLRAVGTRGVYSITKTAPPTRYILQGTGHDELPMMALPPFGAHFQLLSMAQEAANELERRPADPQMGDE